MRSTRFLLAAVAALALSLAACESRGSDVRDTREPDAVGAVSEVVESTDAVVVVFSPDPGYEYFAGTTFEFEDGDLESADGEVLGPGDVAVGDRLEVWVDLCAESFPVQCPDPIGRLLP